MFYYISYTKIIHTPNEKIGFDRVQPIKERVNKRKHVSILLVTKIYILKDQYVLIFTPKHVSEE